MTTPVCASIQARGEFLSMANLDAGVVGIDRQRRLQPGEVRS